MLTLKKCSKCKLEKPLDFFYKHKRSADGLTYECRECNVASQRERYKNNPESRKKTLDRNNRWKNNDPDRYSKVRKKIEEKRSGSFQRKEYNRNLRAKLRTDPIVKIKESISNGILKGLKRSFGSKAGQPAFDALGYTPDQLKEHLEKQFQPWMNWDNYGRYEEGKLKWQIDHIVPHSSFCYTSMQDEAFKKCWALENLRPLEAIENIKKGNKII